MTSNLGAKELKNAMRPGLGFEIAAPQLTLSTGRLSGIGGAAAKRFFLPEFMNRVDATVTYRELGRDSLMAIVDHQIEALQQHINKRLAQKRFKIAVSDATREYILRTGTSVEYGAREIKRVVLRNITQPLATMLVEGKIGSLDRVAIDCRNDGIVIEADKFEIGAAA